MNREYQEGLVHGIILTMLGVFLATSEWFRDLFGSFWIVGMLALTIVAFVLGVRKKREDNHSSK